MTKTDTTQTHAAPRKIDERKLADILIVLGDMQEQEVEAILDCVPHNPEGGLYGFVSIHNEEWCYEYDLVNNDGYWIMRVTDIEDCDVHFGIKISKCKVAGREMYLVRNPQNSKDFVLEETVFCAKYFIQGLVTDGLIDVAYDRAVL